MRKTSVFLAVGILAAGAAMAAAAGGQAVQRPKVPPKLPRGVPKIAADLVVDRVVLYPVNPTADDEVRVTVYLKNQGTGRGFIANGRSLYSIQLPGRAAAKVRDLTGGTWLEPGVANGFSNSLGRMSAYPPGPVGSCLPPTRTTRSAKATRPTTRRRSSSRPSRPAGSTSCPS